MIAFERFELPNGLKILVHTDASTPIVAFNLLYNVGARDEHPEKTGFAHLFEHLMFGGTKAIPSYDEPVEKSGGENNAFTNNDITNYYLTLPKDNLEIAFWLESDRMNKLDFSQKKLDIQKNVVIQEFNQRYLNQPYGDLWLLLRPLIYKSHPYQWCTIGRDISHIQSANLKDVERFFYEHYAPNNAILCVAGDVTISEIKSLAEKWFGTIPRREIATRQWQPELEQSEARFLEVEREVPANMIVKVYRGCNVGSLDYYQLDLLSDVLSNGNSSRFYQKLVKEKKLFSEIDAYITSEIEGGLFVIVGRLLDGISYAVAEEAIQIELNKIMLQPPFEDEVQKVKNKTEMSHVLEMTGVLHKAMRLSFFELLGDANRFNDEIDVYRKISANDLQQLACRIFIPTNASTLYYTAKKETK